MFVPQASRIWTLGLKKKNVVLPFSDRPKILQKLGRDFFFFSIQTSILLLFVSKLAIISTWSFSLVVRIVLNPSVFGFTARKLLWQFGCHHLLCIFCLGSDFDSRYMSKKKKKKRFPTNRPDLKMLSPKGQHNNFFYLALSDNLN